MNIFFITLFLFISLNSSNSFAFTLMASSEPHFTNPVVTVDFSNNNCTNSSATPAILMDLAMKSAELYWNSVPSCKLELKRGEIVNVDLSNPATDFIDVADNHILIGCNAQVSIFTSTSILAVGSISGNKGIVLINDIANNSFDKISESQKMATVAHEIGHAIGIGHSEVEYALMFYSIGLIQERLAYDDMDACHYLYNNDKIINCGSIETVNDSSNNQYLLVLLGFIFVFSLGKLYTNKLG